MLAFVVAVGIASGQLEALIPDVHDGDSHAASVSSTDQPAHEHSGSGPRHTVHVDHCTHGHLVALSDAAPAAAPVLTTSMRREFTALAMPSIEFAPRLRPPIA